MRRNYYEQQAVVVAQRQPLDRSADVEWLFDASGSSSHTGSRDHFCVLASVDHEPDKHNIRRLDSTPQLPTEGQIAELDYSINLQRVNERLQNI